MGEADSQTTELLMVRFSEVVFIDDAFLAGLKTTGGSDYNQRAHFVVLGFGRACLFVYGDNFTTLD